MSSNSFTWFTEGGDLGTADWGCLAGRCRLHATAVWQAALVSDESALEACLRRCTIQIDNLYLLPLVMSFSICRCPLILLLSCPVSVNHDSRHVLSEFMVLRCVQDILVLSDFLQQYFIH